jgi:hypothetical protein
MKTKHWLYLSQVFLIPIFLTTLLIGMIGAEWWLTDKSNLGNLIFNSGAINRPFLTIIFGISIVGLSIIFTVVLMLAQHASKIDRLEEATYELYIAKKKYEAATRKIVEGMSNE